MSYETAIYFRVSGEEAVDSGDGLSFTLHGREAQAGPAPVVYVDGVERDPETYVFIYGGEDTHAGIEFEDPVELPVTCDYRWKYRCGESENLSVYEMRKDLNVRTARDVNGLPMVIENRYKAPAWRGVLVWEYMSMDFWREIRTLVEGDGYSFDIERVSLGAPLDTISNLYPVTYPVFSEEPGVPGLTGVTVEAVQLV